MGDDYRYFVTCYEIEDFIAGNKVAYIQTLSYFNGLYKVSLSMKI